MSIPLPTPSLTAAAQPTPPATLLSQLLAIAVSLDPGLTANLPATLIEDIASTQVGGIAVVDSKYADLINSISPYGSNPGLTVQLGNVYGVPQGLGSNGSVYVVFSSTTSPGLTIPPGFQVSDGTNTYTVQDGGAIGTGGSSQPLYCVAVQSGIFAIPPGTVTAFVSSKPPGANLTCTNPLAGLPAAAAQTIQQYQAQVIQAGLATAQGMPTFLKTQIGKVPGVQPRLVSVKQNGGGWIVTVGGGDPYQVAAAIYAGDCDVSNLEGCVLGVSAITNANPGVMTTNIAHGYSSAQVVQMEDATGMTELNGDMLTITVIDAYHFSIGVDTSSYGAYTGGGVLTPNLRNQTVAINDYPDTYTIPSVNPLQELVQIVASWSTNSQNFVSPAAVAALAVPALVAYINSIVTGQPINLLVMQQVFQQAVASILPVPLITSLNFSVAVAGVGVTPEEGTDIILTDAFSYLETNAALVVVEQS